MTTGEGHTHEGEHRVVADRVPAGVWRVEERASQVNIRARSVFGLLPVNGFFERFGGELRTDQQGGAAGTLELRAASIQTGIDARDARLRSDEFLGADAHPVIDFELESVGPEVRHEMRLSDEERMTVTGRLRIRGRSIPLSFPATVIAHGDHLHIECKVRIDHHAAGLGWSRPGLIGKTVRAEVALTLNPVSGD